MTADDRRGDALSRIAHHRVSRCRELIGNRFHVISGRLQSGGVGPGPVSNYDAHDAFEITDK